MGTCIWCFCTRINLFKFFNGAVRTCCYKYLQCTESKNILSIQKIVSLKRMDQNSSNDSTAALFLSSSKTN